MKYKQTTLTDYGLEFTNPELNRIIKYFKSDEFKKEIERWKRLDRFVERAGRPTRVHDEIIGKPKREFNVEEELRKMEDFDKVIERSLKVSEESLYRRIEPTEPYTPRPKHPNPRVEKQLREWEEFDKACERALQVSPKSLYRRIGSPCYP